MGETKLNWVLFSYNGNNTVARYIHQATRLQVEDFMIEGGACDLTDEEAEMFAFGGPEDCHLISINSDPRFMMSEAGNNMVAWSTDGDEKWARICELPAFYANDEGVILQDHLRETVGT